MSNSIDQIQAPSTVMMIRPSHFGFNRQTAASNTFQNDQADTSLENIRESARREFDGLVSILQSKRIEVLVFDDDPDIITPDAIFPNNWVSFQPDGRIVLYSMMAENRRLERRIDILDQIKVRFVIREIIDISDHETAGEFLEGTGSIVFDHVNKVAYANESPRTSGKLFTRVCDELNYEPVLFRASDKNGFDIYHTNVLMSIGEGHAILCLEAIHPKHRSKVAAKLRSFGLEVLDITFDQLSSFAGNMIQLENDKAEKFQVMSDSAFYSLNQLQIDLLKSYSEIVHEDLSTIEKIGGGSARCMLAGVHLPINESY